jgi:hypothetical protein
MRGLFEESALAQTALDALKPQHQQQRHHQVIDVAAIGSCRKLLGNMAPCRSLAMAVRQGLAEKLNPCFCW